VRKAYIAAIALAAILALAGCTGSHKTTTVSTPKPTAATALGALEPVFPAKLTPTTAKSETVRVADAIQGLIAKTDIVYVDDHSQLVAATKSTPSYYGVLRTVNVSPSLDPIEQATAMSKLLVAAGWIERKNQSATGSYLDALSSDPDGNKSWFVLLGADSTAAKQPVVTIQLASPDLPKK
jgi:hypothetical protein